MTEYKYYHGPAEGEFYRVHLEQDPDASTPREYDNLSTLVTWDSRYLSPDRDGESMYDLPRDLLNGDGNAVRKLAKYVALFRPDVLYMVPLVRNGYDGGLSTDATDRHNNHDGLAYVTAADWKLLMGDTPSDGTRGLTPAEAIEQEVELYNSWAAGEYVGYIVERAHRWTDADGERTYTWDDTDMACWGIDDRDYAWQAAFDALPDGSYQLGPDEFAELAE